VRSASNLLVGEIKDVLKKFCIDDPWSHMRNLAARVGFGGLPLDSAYTTAMDRRHVAAHQASAGVAHNDLADFATQARAIAFTFDALLSRAGRRLMLGDAGLLSGAKVTQHQIGIRFLDETENGCREYKEGAGRAYKVHPSAASAHGAAMQRASQDFSVLVERDQKSIPTSWFPTDL
jgi:hypothetical protein